MEHVHFGILSLIPTVITLSIAYITKRVWLALLLGVLSGAMVFSFSLQGIIRFAQYLFISFTDIERLKIAFFVVMVAILLEIIARTGANIKFGEYVGDLLKTRRKTRLTAWFTGVALFFDDYANLLITGASLRPVTDKHKISPSLLGYMADAVAIIASVSFISTWAAFEMSLLPDNPSVTRSDLFISSLPFHLYTYMSIGLAFFVAVSGRWFSYKLDNGSGIITEKVKIPNEDNARRRDIVIPIAILVGVSIIGILIWGWIATEPEKRGSFAEILGNAPAITVLNIAVIVAFFTLIWILRKDNVLSGKEIRSAFVARIRHMAGTLLIILLAKGLELCAHDLGTGVFISQLLGTSMPALFIPALMFCVTGLATIVTGFSWSSMVLMMPIALQLAQGTTEHTAMITAACIGAVISGSIAGAQLVPYSDTSIMTSTACGLQPVYHVKTQALQIVVAWGSALLGFVLLGFGLTLPVAAVISFVTMGVVHWLFAKESRYPLS